MWKNEDNGVNVTVPSSTADLATMEAAGWLYKPPAAVAGKTLWQTQRLYDSDDGGTPVTFSGNGKPVPADLFFINSYWQNAVPLGAADGSQGNKTEFRFAKNTSFTDAPLLTNNVRNPAGWSLIPPALGANEYLWFTIAEIDGDLNTLVGTWSAPVRNTGPALQAQGTVKVFTSPISIYIVPEDEFNYYIFATNNLGVVKTIQLPEQFPGRTVTIFNNPGGTGDFKVLLNAGGEILNENDRDESIDGHILSPGEYTVLQFRSKDLSGCYFHVINSNRINSRPIVSQNAGWVNTLPPQNPSKIYSNSLENNSLTNPCS
jgi:hypothetical protein